MTLVYDGRHKPKQTRAKNFVGNEPSDHCQTPAYAIQPLVSIIPKNWIIWENACGQHTLVKAFSKHGYKIIGTDIVDGHNFFRCTLASANCIVTNPPYSIKYQWLEECYKRAIPFALLMPAETYFSGTLQRLEKQYGKIELIRFDKRINFHMPNIGWNGSSAQFPTAWFTHGFNIGQQVSSVELDRNWS